MNNVSIQGEMTLLQARVEMYFRFTRKRCAADIEVQILRAKITKKLRRKYHT